MPHARASTRAVAFALLCLACTLFVLPLAWMAMTAIKPADQVLDAQRVLPTPLTSVPAYAAENARTVWQDPIVDFPLYFRNTLLVTLLSVLGTVLSSAVVAYGFSRVRWRGRDACFAVVLATMLVPFPVIMGPLYIVFKHLGWIGTFLPLWAPAWCGHALSIFLLRQFFLTIPRELNDAARIDGCGHFQTFLRVMLPLSKPALSVVALLHFVFVWNDFLAPLIFLSDRDQYTLALGLALYQSQGGSTPWNLLMAATTLTVLPVLLVYVLAQRSLIDGIATQGMREA